MAEIAVPSATSGTSGPTGLYRDDAYYALLAASVTLGTSGELVTPGNGTMIAWLIEVADDDIGIDGAEIYVQTAGSAGARIRLGIYPLLAGSAGPSALVDSGEINVETTGYKLPTWTGVSLPRGMYVGVILGNNATTVLRTPSLVASSGVSAAPTFHDLGVPTSSTDRYTALTGAQAYGALPATPPTLTPSNSVKPPFVAWRVQRDS